MKVLDEFYTDTVVHGYQLLRMDALTGTIPSSNYTEAAVEDVFEALYGRMRAIQWMRGIQFVTPTGESIEIILESDREVHFAQLTHIRPIANATAGSASILFERRVLRQDYHDIFPNFVVAQDWTPDSSVNYDSTSFGSVMTSFACLMYGTL